jgi:hypothetical protein
MPLLTLLGGESRTHRLLGIMSRMLPAREVVLLESSAAFEACEEEVDSPANQLSPARTLRICQLIEHG